MDIQLGSSMSRDKKVARRGYGSQPSQGGRGGGMKFKRKFEGDR